MSGVVVAPADAAPGPAPILAWAHGSVGIQPRCGASHTGDPYQQTPAVEEMLARGFVVVATDYPGLGTPGIHPYLVGPSEARAVLDGVRAARELVPAAGRRFAVWGASQGGHAALWTAQITEEYAPDLRLVAAAASAPATDLGRIVQAQRDQKAGGIFLAQLLVAWARIHPEATLDQVVRPDRRERLERMARVCFTSPGGILGMGGVLTPREYLASDPTSTEPWAGLLAANTPDDPIDVPLLLTQGTEDEVVPPELTRREMRTRCDRGEVVSYVPLPGVAHDGRDAAAAPTLEWIADRFAGRPVQGACELRPGISP